MNHGYYHVSWGGKLSLAAAQARQLRDLALVSAGGLRLWHASHLQDVAHTRRVLDEAGRRGVRVLLEDVHPSERPHFAGHTALLAFSVADDANKKSPQELLALCDCTGPRYISIGAGTNRDEAWTYGRSESIGLQVYPFPGERLADYWPVMVRARELADGHVQQLVANLQVHGNGSATRPTAGQVRALGWMAAAAGADAVLWYAQQDSDGSRVTDTLHRAVVRVAAEHRDLAGRATVSQVGDVLTAAWAGGPVVRLNLARSQVLSVGRSR